MEGNKSDDIASEQPEKERILTNEEYNKDLKEKIEIRHDSILINFEEFINYVPDLAIWLKNIVRYGNVDSQALIFIKNTKSNSIYPDAIHFSIELFTNEYEYSIYGFTPTENKPKGYLGAGFSTRKSRVGEDWKRGNDLPDGDYCKETFDKIINKMLANEFKKLQLWR